MNGEEFFQMNMKAWIVAAKTNPALVESLMAVLDANPTDNPISQEDGGTAVWEP